MAFRKVCEASFCLPMSQRLFLFTWHTPHSELARFPTSLSVCGQGPVPLIPMVTVMQIDWRRSIDKLTGIQWRGCIAGRSRRTWWYSVSRLNLWVHVGRSRSGESAQVTGITQLASIDTVGLLLYRHYHSTADFPFNFWSLGNNWKILFTFYIFLLYVYNEINH